MTERKDKATGKRITSEAAPLAAQHTDYIDAGVFVPFARAIAAARSSATIPLDVMCEAKAKDLAVLRLREELQTVAPDFDPGWALTLSQPNIRVLSQPLP